ncbi:hypothetical protein NDU88_001394 [Pleurodeles waltl]|uniref:Uncharacterized protein n=1 Tax=Pleurodeles waltl TaxID=8319 RepID=A0AAV7S781_PLEWA|nr:hypothetical protein NDU88_001394 [Pleurodeles waltl]
MPHQVPPSSVCALSADVGRTWVSLSGKISGRRSERGRPQGIGALWHPGSPRCCPWTEEADGRLPVACFVGDPHSSRLGQQDRAPAQLHVAQAIRGEWDPTEAFKFVWSRSQALRWGQLLCGTPPHTKCALDDRHPPRSPTWAPRQGTLPGQQMSASCRVVQGNICHPRWPRGQARLSRRFKPQRLVPSKKEYKRGPSPLQVSMWGLEAQVPVVRPIGPPVLEDASHMSGVHERGGEGVCMPSVA